MSYETFDPYHVSKKDMNLLADSIEGFLDFQGEVMVRPKGLNDKQWETIIEARKEVREDLIKKLRKCKRSVFKDEDEWNTLE